LLYFTKLLIEMKVDFIFDIASPNTYLAHKLIPNFEDRTGVKFNYIPCLNSNVLFVSLTSKVSILPLVHLIDTFSIFSPSRKP